MLSKPRKRIYYIVGISLFFMLYLFVEWQSFSQDKISRRDLSFEVQKGSNIRGILIQLTQQGVRTKPLIFELVIRITGSEKSIHAGEYKITPESTSLNLFKMLVEGDVVMRKFTIVEGWNIKILFSEIKKYPHLKNDLSNLNSEQIIEKLKLKYRHLEGLFYPETYEFAKNTDVSLILSDAYLAMEKKLKDEWKKRDKNIPYKKPYEALIAASLIEKETALDKERELISAVIARRLKKRMYLQIDPTVIYGMGNKYDGNLKRSDLKKDTEYNSYTRKGLPPTPIAFPRLSSIHAALHPAKTKALYFVATGDGDGGHIFSNNLKNHLAAVEKLRKTKDEVKS